MPPVVVRQRLAVRPRRPGREAAGTGCGCAPGTTATRSPGPRLRGQAHGVDRAIEAEAGDADLHGGESAATGTTIATVWAAGAGLALRRGGREEDPLEREEARRTITESLEEAGPVTLDELGVELGRELCLEAGQRRALHPFDDVGGRSEVVGVHLQPHVLLDEAELVEDAGIGLGRKDVRGHDVGRRRADEGGSEGLLSGQLRRHDVHRLVGVGGHLHGQLAARHQRVAPAGQHSRMVRSPVERGVGQHDVPSRPIGPGAEVALDETQAVGCQSPRSASIVGSCRHRGPRPPRAARAARPSGAGYRTPGRRPDPREPVRRGREGRRRPGCAHRGSARTASDPKRHAAELVFYSSTYGLSSRNAAMPGRAPVRRRAVLSDPSTPRGSSRRSLR